MRLGLLLGMFLVLAAAAVAVIFVADARAHDSSDPLDQVTIPIKSGENEVAVANGTACDDAICVRRSGNTIEVLHVPGKFPRVLRITALRDNTQERGGLKDHETKDDKDQTCDDPEAIIWYDDNNDNIRDEEGQGDDYSSELTYCSYDDSQFERLSDTFDYECQGKGAARQTMNTVRIYVVYEKFRAVSSIPAHSGSDMLEVWQHGLVFPVSCT